MNRKLFLSFCWLRGLHILPFLLVSLFYLLATSNGNNTTSDSHLYRAIAENLALEFSYVGGNGNLIIYWPPLYSLILSLAYPYVGEFILVFHWLCLMGTLFVWREIAKEYLQYYWLSIFTIFLALSTPLLMLAVFVWTEIFFVLLFSLSCFFTSKFIQSRTYSFLFIAALFAFFMMLQRNAGFFLFVGGFLSLLCVLPSYQKKDLALVILSGLLAVSGFAVWNVYVIIIRGNLHVPGELLPFISFGRNFMLTFKELGANLIPAALPSFFVIFTACTALLLSGKYVLKYRRQYPSLFFFLITMVFYLLLWVIIPADKYNISRFIAVILPVFYLFVFILFTVIYEEYPKLRFPLLVSLLVWGAYSLMRIVNNVMLWGNLS